MSLALTEAILKRFRGIETLTGDALAAQTGLAAMLAKIGLNNYPAVWYGPKSQDATYPSITFHEQAGPEPIGGIDIGILTTAIYRLELWDNGREGDTLPQMADYIECLFDERRRAPALTLTGDGVIYYGELFSGLEAPHHDDNRNCFFGLMSLRFVEARP